MENLLLFSVTEIFSLAQSYTSGIDFSRRFHKYFLENQSGSKPQWRIVQTDDTMTLQRYTAVIPGTHAELLQEAYTDEFHKIESGSIQDSKVKEWDGR